MFSRYRNLLRGNKGFTLLEVMTAITILLLVILPLASLYVKSLTVIQNAALYSQAIQLAQERMEICGALEYPNLSYYNEIFAPGFQFDPEAYDNRDIVETTPFEYYYDPTDSDNNGYSVPIYRDYYNNYTGLLLDPNYNGLCDDDLDGDGEAGILASGGIDMEDVEIATNGLLTMYSDPQFTGTPAAALGDTYVPGDGLFDTIVEGRYVASMDPMYKMVRETESQTPLLDVALLLDQAHRAAVSDYRHRETAFQNFVRMTSFIDPTPTLANPNDVDTWIDMNYIYHLQDPGTYTDEMVAKLILCLMRDLPLQSNITNFDVGTADAGLVELDAFGVNYSPPTYGIKIIVTVFYLTGEGEIQLIDIDGDGVVDEVPMETYGGARRIRLERTFHNDLQYDGVSPLYRYLRALYNNDPSLIIKAYAPPRRFELSTSGSDDNPVRSLTITDIDDGADGSDPCDFDHDGLLYLD